MMKFKTLSTIRRSLKGDEQPKQPSRATAPAAIIPPKKVIRALYDFQAETEHELSFKAGDFFHVIGNENDKDWFEAYNPLTNARGMVPVNFFQVLGKTEARPHSRNPPLPPVPQVAAGGDWHAGGGAGGGGGGETRHSGGGGYPHSATSSATGGRAQQQQQHQRAPSHPAATSPPSSRQRPKREPLHAVAMYDFEPERPDELQAGAGDNLIIIAQSNEEWFVAMHPGKLGGPGLIPVAFVEIRDEHGEPIPDDVETWLRKKNIELPGVEEWKRMTTEGGHKEQPQSPQQQQQQARPSQHIQQPATRMVADIVSATVDSYLTQQDQYWFHLTLKMRDRSERSLYRLYEDFYNFQIHLLDTFPAEAGRTGGERILPYMPGPLSFVNDVITSQRRADLDVYVQELLALPDYVRECELMRGFFGLDEEEEEEHAEPQPSGQRLSHQRQQDRHSGHSGHSGRRANGGDEYASPPAPPVADEEYSRPQPPAQMLKIKVQYGEDILAIRVPSRATFAVLWERVRERLGDRVRRLEWKDLKGEYRPLDDSEDFQRALHETQGKLLVIAS